MSDYYLDTWGYNSYPYCSGIEIYKDGIHIWESSLVDSEQYISDEDLDLLRQELKEFLAEEKIGHLYNKDIDSENSIYNWELEGQLSWEKWNMQYYPIRFSKILNQRLRKNVYNSDDIVNAADLIELLIKKLK